MRGFQQRRVNFLVHAPLSFHNRVDLMIQRQDEAIVLRVWPFQEADLLVSFFTRQQGRLKGIARHAMRSRKRFGGALEPMTQVRAAWVEKPKQELVRLEAFDVLWSPLREPMDYARAAALSVMAEVLESAFPEHAPDDDVFRLVLAVSHQVRAADVWLATTYFLLWITRLLGWMPDLLHCHRCGRSLRGQGAFYAPTIDGLTCEEHRRDGSLAIRVDSLALAEKIFATPITAMEQEAFPRTRAVDLRRFVVSVLERHLEDRLLSARALARI